jgi:hypothetical protein
MLSLRTTSSSFFNCLVLPLLNEVFILCTGVKGPGYNIAFIAGYGSIAWYIYMDK